MDCQDEHQGIHKKGGDSQIDSKMAPQIGEFQMLSILKTTFVYPNFEDFESHLSGAIENFPLV